MVFYNQKGISAEMVESGLIDNRNSVPLRQIYQRLCQRVSFDWALLPSGSLTLINNIPCCLPLVESTSDRCWLSYAGSVLSWCFEK